MAGDLRFDWDAANISHIARHHVKREEIEQVLRNAPVDFNYEVVNGEERWTSIGHTDNFRVLLVVWTLRDDDDVRAITAREVGESAQIKYLRAKGFGV